MGCCWHCHWGWPEPIAAIYRQAYRDILDLGNDPDTALEYGPAHIVWSDENFERRHTTSCLAGCDSPDYADWDPLVLNVVRRSLRELAALPDDLKTPPHDYDDEHPEQYPPPADWVMDKWQGHPDRDGTE